MLHLAVLALALAADPGPWAYWRGPSQQGYCDDARLPLSWSADKNLLWKVKLPGPGNSTPLIVGDRIVLTASNGASRIVFALSTTDGKLLWEQTPVANAPAEKSHEWNGYASASVATDGTRLFAFFGTPGLFCYDLAGKPLWQKQFGSFPSEAGWGTAATPFVWKNLVIQNCDNDAPTNPGAGVAPADLVALDAATGKEVWRTPRNQGRGFSTPLLIKGELVLNGPLGVWAYDPATGKELWHCDRQHSDEDKFGEPLPVFANGTLYATSGRPGTLQAIGPGGKLLWETKRKGSRDISSPILAGGVIYLTDRQSQISGYDAKTGDLLFRERTGGGSPFVASPVQVQGKLLFPREDGTTFVVEPGRKLKIVGKNELSDGSAFRASPAAAGGVLYLRSQTQLYAVGGGK